MTYSCCPYPFSDVTYSFTLDRKPNYHILNMVVPCVIISFLSLVSFYLPPDCGERIGLSMTALLALSVYLLIISDKLPETSDFVSRLGLYYMFVMGELALALTATGLSLRCHFSRQKPPKFLMRLVRRRKADKVRSIYVQPDAETKQNNGTNNTTQNGSIVKHSEERKENDKELWHEYWMDIALCLDRIFLAVFTTLFIVTTLAILLSRKA
jgi:hypothetical protein